MPIFDNMTPDEREVLMNKIVEVMSLAQPGECMGHPRNQIYRLMQFKDSNYHLKTIKFTPELLDSITALIAEYAVAPVERKCRLRDRSGIFKFYTCTIKNTRISFKRDERPNQVGLWEMTSVDV